MPPTPSPFAPSALSVTFLIMYRLSFNLYLNPVVSPISTPPHNSRLDVHTMQVSLIDKRDVCKPMSDPLFLFTPTPPPKQCDIFYTSQHKLGHEITVRTPDSETCLQIIIKKKNQMKIKELKQPKEIVNGIASLQFTGRNMQVTHNTIQNCYDLNSFTSLNDSLQRALAHLDKSLNQLNKSLSSKRRIKIE